MVPAAPVRVVVVSEPTAGVQVNADFGIGVAVVDDFGNVVSSYSGDVSAVLERDPRGGLLAGTLTLAVSQGYAEFSDLSVKKAGVDRVIRITAAGLRPARTSTFDVTSTVHASVKSSARLPRDHRAAVNTDRDRVRRRG